MAILARKSRKRTRTRTKTSSQARRSSPPIPPMATASLPCPPPWRHKPNNHNKHPNNTSSSSSSSSSNSRHIPEGHPAFLRQAVLILPTRVPYQVQSLADPCRVDLLQDNKVLPAFPVPVRSRSRSWPGSSRRCFWLPLRRASCTSRWHGFRHPCSWSRLAPIAQDERTGCADDRSTRKQAPTLASGVSAVHPAAASLVCHCLVWP